LGAIGAFYDLPRQAQRALPEGWLVRAPPRYSRRVPRRLLHPRRAALVLACAALVLALAGVCAPGAMSASVGGSNAFKELTEAGAQTTTTPTQTSKTGETSSNSSSSSTTLIFAASGAALVLLVAIAFAIVRDARSVAPAGDAQLSEARAGRDSAARLRRRRAQAKAARRQRKRNR
jgi:ABC-type Fe3+ transport system permease subunit